MGLVQKLHKNVPKHQMAVEPGQGVTLRKADGAVQSVHDDGC